jgi:aquaporin Z
MQQKLTTEFIGTFFLSLTICTAAVYVSDNEYAPFGIAATLMVMIYAGGHISEAPVKRMRFFHTLLHKL